MKAMWGPLQPVVEYFPLHRIRCKQKHSVACIKSFFAWRGLEETAGWVRAFGGQSAGRGSGPPGLYATGKLLFIFSIGLLSALLARPVFRLNRRPAASTS